MEFRELDYVLAIEKYQSITKAAKALYISQPTLSKFLISLERSLGQKLFRKLGNKYVLTYAGEQYVAAAKEILRLKSNLDIQLADILKRDVGVLNVAFPHMRCIYMLPTTLPAFQAEPPNVKVNIFEGSSDENDRFLLDGKAEIAFYSKPEVLNPLLEYETLNKEEMLLCLRKGHPLGHYAQPNPASRYPRLDPRLLQNELILQPLSDQRTRQITDRYFSGIGLKFENTMDISSLPAIMELVSVGYGAAFIFETHLMHHHFTHPIDCYSFGEPKTVSDFVVAHRRGSYLPSCAYDFIKIAREQVTTGGIGDFRARTDGPGEP